MNIVKIILTVIYVIVCLAVIVLVMKQNKDDKGASGTITGASSSNFYEKNKGRTREGKLKKWTLIFGVLFIVLTLVLGIISVIK